MTGHTRRDARHAWRLELRRTNDCPPVERLADELQQDERDHVAHCTACQAELALWREVSGEPTADEGAAVQWVVAEIRRRRAGISGGTGWSAGWGARLRSLRPRTLAMAAATAVAAVAIGYVVQDREPSVGIRAPADETYRSSRIQVLEPTGDVLRAPTQLRWTASPGAARYDVEVLEVDRTTLWRASTREPRVELPPAVIAQFVAGKTILWEVTARSSDETVGAQTGTQRFRVAVKAAPRED